MHPALERFAQKALRNSRLMSRGVELVRSSMVSKGYCQGQQLFRNVPPAGKPRQKPNRLRSYFDSHREGNGIHKWNHYFDIYERHLSKFVGQPVNICEIGVYSGGSLEMWRDYFGEHCNVYGIDIEPVCKTYENSHVKIFIGDQANRNFWADFRRQVPSLDILVDDGGHTVDQQIVTLEETLPHLSPGGVFICEDIHGVSNEFARYVSGLALNLNAGYGFKNNEDQERSITVSASSFQSAIGSVCLYPFAVVIERTDEPREELIAAMRGTVWQPFMHWDPVKRISRPPEYLETGNRLARK